MQFIYISVLLKRIKAIKVFMRDKNVPKRKKAIIIFGFIFLLWPLPLIPIPVLGLAIVDDIILWSFIIYYLKDELDKYWIGEDQEKKRKKDFKGKTVIDGTFSEDDDNGY